MPTPEEIIGADAVLALQFAGYSIVPNSFMLDLIFERTIPEPNTGCHLWLFALNTKGYAINHKGYVHREVLRLKLGRPILDGMFACHTCDQRCCVNPDHLYEGTPADNAADRMRRGRHGHGDGNPILTEDEVIELRDLVVKYHPILNAKRVAKELGVSHKVVLDAVNGRTWSRL